MASEKEEGRSSLKMDLASKVKLSEVSSMDKVNISMLKGS